MTETALPAAVVEARLTTALRSINKNYEGSIEPVRRGSGSHATRAAFPALPVSAHVLDVRSTACGRLEKCARCVMVERRLRPNLRAGDVPALTHFLTIHTPWIADRPCAPQAMAALEASATDLAGISTAGSDGSALLGACPLTAATDGTSTPCHGQVRSLADKGTCQRCGTTGDNTWWEHHMFPEASRLVTARQLVKEIHQQRGQRVSEVTIRVWLNRGIITSVGLDEEGRRLYDKGAVATALSRADCA
jgi:hypothetical protein